MKKLMILFIIALYLILNSCTESTTNPNNDNNINNDLLTKYTWEFKNSDNGKTTENLKLKFFLDGSSSFFMQDIWTTGDWQLIKNDSILTNFPGGKTESFKIVDISNSQLVIRVVLENQITLLTYIPVKNTSQSLQVSGNISFFPTISDQNLAGAKVVAIWISPLNEFDAIVWGIGTVDANNKTYSINIDNNVPTSLFSYDPPRIDGYFNLAYIALVWDNNVKNGTVYNIMNMLSSMNKIGMVEDRGILYISGDYKSWTIDYLYGDFEQGYNFCKGWYTTEIGTNDKWQVTSEMNNQTMLVLETKDWGNFKLPNWN